MGSATVKFTRTPEQPRTVKYKGYTIRWSGAASMSAGPLVSSFPGRAN